MRLRVCLLVSLGLNAALAVAWLSASRRPLVPVPIPAPLPTALAAPAPVFRTNTVVRRENFTWDQLESSDYKKYIANLRWIGCPEPTIRDIIVAEVNAHFDRRRVTEVNTPEQQWWRADPDPEIEAAAARQFEELERERESMLVELLGPNWENNPMAALAEFNALLDGPVLGRLPAETKESLRQMEMRMARRRHEIEQEGKPPEARERDYRKLRAQTRTELAKLLNPTQLEEYQLRYSETASDLREETRGLGLTPDEFRKVFRARDQVDQQVETQLAGTDEANRQATAELERKRETALREALGPERYRLYRNIQDPLFRNAQAIVRDANAAPQQVLPLYELAQAAEEERRRIRSDNALEPEQRAAALERVVLDHEQSIRRLIGDEAYEAYRNSRE